MATNEGEGSLPLLRKGEHQYHLGCPGCDHDRSKELQTGMPALQGVPLCLDDLPYNRSPRTTTLGDRRLGVHIHTITTDFKRVSKIHGKLGIVLSCLPPIPILCVGFHLPASVVLSHFYKGSRMNSTGRSWNLQLTNISSSLDLVLLS